MLILGAWMGSLAFFGVVKMRAGAVLASSHDVDLLLRDLLGWLDAFGLAAGPLALLTLAVGWAPLQVPLRARALGLVAATLIAVISGRWLGPRRAELVAELGHRLEHADPASERAIELAQLQQVGSSLLLVLAALTALLTAAAVASSRPRRRFGIEL